MDSIKENNSIKTPDNNKQRWDDIVFENRNQDYGAYVLRKDYSNNVVFGLIMTILVTILIIVATV